MLSLGGHFSTKSRRYSTTLRCLRQAHQDCHNKRLVTTLGCPEGIQVDRHHEHRQGDDKDDEDSILVLGHWQYRRRRHSPEGIYARTIAPDIPESRRVAREIEKEER